MNLSELRSLMSYWVDDLQMGYFTPTQMNVFLNNGLRQLQKVLVQCNSDFYLKKVTRDTIINQDNYILPSDFSKVRKLEYVEGTAPNDTKTTLTPITIMQEDAFQNYGDPIAYYVRGNYLILRPIPQSVLTLQMLYVYDVATMGDDSDSPDAPLRYHEFIPLYGLRDCYIKDTRAPSQVLVDKIKAFEDALKEDAQNNVIQEPRYVVTTSDDIEGILI